MLRRGRGQSAYTDKFLQHDEDLKVYLLDCRKEAGILKVIVWVLARNEIELPELSVGDLLLTAKADTFFKPELSAFFSEFSDFEQQGFLFQLPFNGIFSDLQLGLTDRKGHQVELPIGRFFAYDEAEPELAANSPDSSNIRLFTHQWASSGSGASIFNPEQFKADGAAYLLLHAQDTVLPPKLLLALQHFLSKHPETDIIYFDEDLLDPDGNFHSPSFKPAFSPEYLAADNYIGPNFCVSFRLAKQLNWFSALDLRSGGYHFLLRTMEITDRFARLPGIRLHRTEQGLVHYTRKEAAEIQVRTEHFAKRGIQLNPGLVPGSSEVLQPVQGTPKVSIIIPFKDQLDLLEQCIQSIFSRTRYPEYELLLISNNSREAKTYQFLETLQQTSPQVRWFRRDHPFNFSQLNNWAAQQAKGEFLLLLNNDVKVITSGWITRMLSYFADERVGAVGAKLLYPDHTVQHAGIVTGIGGIAGHTHKHYPDHFGGYNGRANKVQNVSACTAACLMLRTSVFESVGGFDEQQLPVAFNDVDLCLKIHEAGYRIVYTPFVKLYHYESISRGAEDTGEKRKRAKREIRFFRKKWRNFIQAGDPYYHPELSLRMGNFEDFRKLDGGGINH
ncbi:glycosyltransferase family 2 protein [Flavilitoribacter nigricans]|nr:glycosyltransferase family 2 protein [Flavilitoribacter nigricans]